VQGISTHITALVKAMNFTYKAMAFYASAKPTFK
jgi:hypothetical protein